jgi:hypothetical protein
MPKTGRELHIVWSPNKLITTTMVWTPLKEPSGESPAA